MNTTRQNWIGHHKVSMRHYRIDGNGSLRRLVSKRDKSVSARQARRAKRYQKNLVWMTNEVIRRNQLVLSRRGMGETIPREVAEQVAKQILADNHGRIPEFGFCGRGYATTRATQTKAQRQPRGTARAINAALETVSF